MAEKIYEKEGAHTLSLCDRTGLSLTGVTDVKRFDESEVALSTLCGDLTVEGEGLHISTLDIAHGEVVVDGRVSGILYEDAAPLKKGRFKGFFG